MIIPQSWQDALRKVQEGGFHEAVIAGGCLRDLDHGIPIAEVKDVDIFVRAFRPELGSLADDLLTKALGGPLTVFDRENFKEYFDWNRITFAASTGSGTSG